ncbi:hypothetical protein E8F11_10440 [Pseudomonas sp. BN417]|uniref:hypothetical protein n=1 Tax=Pseudomonas sp. BN417 TaxID=2567890 RepID=UPI002456EB52|nr:hypothetical protein [Pseudomonas sp. BN417]MDH4555590.1 hypothetical protein [Pseudomonas sp. BN417]
MKNRISVLAVSTLAIAGCDNYKGEFEQAIAQDLEANGSLCLGIKTWPVDVTILEIKSKSLRAITFANLQSAGLVNGEDAAIKTPGWKMPIARYTPSEKLKPFMVGPDICWGKKVLAEVVKWDGPMSNGDYKEATVTFNYGVITAPWLPESNLPLYYPEMLQASAGTQTAQVTLKLTSVGWEAK